MKVLLTGGAGYIGSHTALSLVRAGHSILILDNLSNGNLLSINRIKRLSNLEVNFVKCDVRDRVSLSKAFENFNPDAVIHFAGLKSVKESLNSPALYYDVNVGGTAVLLDIMENYGCSKIVFSSSATVYGTPIYLPCDENHPVNPINPYGRTKLVAEQLLHDWCFLKGNRKATILRYFNPVGADPSGLIGEDPTGIPQNLMPFVAQVALGKLPVLKIYGNDYDTHDGTGVRDFIHVSDLARAHVLSVEQQDMMEGLETFNIGRGEGVSVLEIVHEFEKVSGIKINAQIEPRRDGDAPEVWADVKLATEKLGFIANADVKMMCEDVWRWQNKNPTGYK